MMAATRDFDGPEVEVPMDMIFELQNCNARDSGRPSAQAIYELLRSAILNGELATGCRLTPTRHSAKRFGLSRSTMVAIYERLGTDELIEPRRGSGTYVSFRRPGHDPPPIDQPWFLPRPGWSDLWNEGLDPGLGARCRPIRATRSSFGPDSSIRNYFRSTGSGEAWRRRFGRWSDRLPSTDRMSAFRATMACGARSQIMSH